MTRVIGSVCLALLAAPALCAGAQQAPVDTIRIGVVGPITTKQRSYGLGHLQGIEFALLHDSEFALALAKDEKKRASTNALGGRRVELLIADDRGDADDGAEAVKALINQGACVVMGPCNSRVTASVLHAVLRKETPLVPIVTPIATATTLTSLANELTGKLRLGGQGLPERWFFRCNVSDRKRISRLLRSEMAKEEGRPTKVAVVYEKDDTYGEGLWRDVQAERDDPKKQGQYHGVDFVDAAYRPSLTQGVAKGVFKKLYDEKCHGKTALCLLGGDEADLVEIIRGLRSRGSAATLYVVEGSHLHLTAAAKREPLVEGTVLFSAYAHKSPRTEDVLASFPREFNVERPDFAAALSHDAALVVMAAIKKAVGRLDSNGESRWGIRDLRPAVARAIAEELATRDDAREESFAVEGTHVWDENGEYESLEFNTYVISAGKKKDDDKAAEDKKKKEEDTDMPPLFAFAIVYLSAVLGGWLREIQTTRTPRTWRKVAGGILTPLSLVARPVIALTVWSWGCLTALLAQPDWLSYSKHFVFVSMAAMLCGVLAGYAGFAAIRYLLGKLGVAPPSQDEPGAATP